MATTNNKITASQPEMGLALNRRGFLVRALGGLSLGFFLPEAGHFFDLQAADPPPQQLANAYIRIFPDNTVTLLFGGCEMGQGTKTGLAQILAEELFVEWNQVKVEQSLVDPIVTYGTGGSSGVSRRYDRLRNAGAAARELLILAAMDKTGDTNRNNYRAQSATVVYTGPNPVSPGVWTYGALASAAALKTVPADLRLTNPANFRLIGKPLSRVDIPAKTDGSAIYGIDVWFPDMVFAAIKHCPTIGGVMAALPATPRGALAVVPCKASDTRGAITAGTVNAVAVVATDTWTAKNLANSLSVSWTLPASTAGVDSAAILAQAQSLMASGAGVLVAEPVPPTGYTPATYAPVIEGQVNSAMGTPTIDSTYSLPYVAHATMEVLNCSVKFAFNAAGAPASCEIWAPNQNATSVTTYAAAASGLLPAAIKVNTTYLGGGLGRKIEQDYVSQAVQVALVVKRPVKLTWMREEDFTHDQYRPMALVNVKAKLSGSNITAWAYRTVTPSISQQRGRLAAGAIDSQAVECARNLPYNLGTHVVEWVPSPAGIPVGYWRSVGASIHVFAVESFIDELAKSANVDPFTFRYSLLTDLPDNRARNVLAAADAMSLTWRNSLPAGRAWGVAIGEAFGTWVCEVVEISAPTATSITVHRVNCAVDCGMAINPNSVEAQMQGGIVHGLNATLWGQTTFTAGKANQKNFNVNRMLRLNEMPQITVKIVQSSTTAPTGTGEPGVPPVAAAVGNAYARLTGKRQRSLPFFPGAVMGGI